MDPARMFKESLTSRPELENSQGRSISTFLQLASPRPIYPKLQTYRCTAPIEAMGYNRTHAPQQSAASRSPGGSIRFRAVLRKLVAA
jgi:hypothetical protein